MPRPFEEDILHASFLVPIFSVCEPEGYGGLGRAKRSSGRPLRPVTPRFQCTAWHMGLHMRQKDVPASVTMQCNASRACIQILTIMTKKTRLTALFRADFMIKDHERIEEN